MTTPFDEQTGDVSAVALRENARRLLDVGASGIVAAGSTGEAALLSDDEARQIVGWLRDVVPEDRSLIIGAGRESTRATVAACRAGAEEGAEAALVRPPGYYGASLTAQALITHFRRVADESPIPLLIYNIPKYTHVPLTDTILEALADHENVAGAKDSSGDLKNFSRYRDAVPNWTLYIGSGALLYAALEVGAAGGILAVANFAADIAVQVTRAFEGGDKAAAGQAQERLTPLHKEIVATFGPAGVKAAMDVAGLHGGPVRSPLMSVSDADEARVRDLMQAARPASV
jgi:4-hydroxy-2-oxoglutarate aldolase